MKIFKNQKVEKVCSKDENRPVLGQLYFEVETNKRAVLIATDGKIMVHIPVIPEPYDKTGLVPPEALKYARRVQEEDETGHIKLDLSEKCSVRTADICASYERMNHLSFPNTRQIFPKTKPKAYIAFNVKLLKAIADAMDTEQVFLEIREPDKAIVVRPDDQSEMIGILMPMEKNGTDYGAKIPKQPELSEKAEKK